MDPWISWIIDSGATAHMSFNKSVFSEFQEMSPFSVGMGDNSSVTAHGRGTTWISLLVNGHSVRCKLQNVLYVPELSYQLLSVGVMDDMGLETTFGDNVCRITKGTRLMAMGTLHNGLYVLNTSSGSQSPKETQREMAMVANLNLWHQRLAHVHEDGIRTMVRNGVVEGIKLDPNQKLGTCSGCVYGKSTRAQIPKQGGTRTKKVLDRVYTDVCGPFQVQSLGGSRYFLSFVDDHSRYCWVYPIKKKSDVLDTLKWLTMVEKQYSHSIEELLVDRPVQEKDGATNVKVIHSDNGGEYVSRAMKEFLESRGIRHRCTAPENPHQNGVAERMNRTLMELVRAMLHHKGLQKSFWAEALAVAVHVRNRVTTRGLPAMTTPYEVMYEEKPNLSYLRVFGSQCSYTAKKQSVGKLDARAHEAIMIGYARGSRAYKLWDPANRCVVVSRDVRFNETKEAPAMHVGDAMDDLKEDEIVDMSNSPEVVDSSNSIRHSPSQNDSEHSELEVASSVAPASDGERDEQQKDVASDPPQLRRSTRERRAPWWRATVALLSSTSSDPKTYQQASSGPDAAKWASAMDIEYKSLMEHETWTLVSRPANQNVVSSKWVYKVKEEQQPDGSLGIRYKARMVARGFSQVEGVDYTETFAPVVKFTSVRVLLSIVSSQNLILHQMDVITAFLNGDLEEDVYMEQPLGYEKGDPSSVVCKLRKSLYGLKQAPRQWYAKIDEFFVNKLQMEGNPADECVYMRRSGGQLLIVALYVDDLLIACSDENVLYATKAELCKRFKMKDLGESHVMLGMDLERDHAVKTLTLTQTRYTSKILERFGMSSAKGCATPMETGINLTKIDDEPCGEKYRAVIGALMYLMVGTRPDIAFAVCTLAKHVETPRAGHWKALQRVMRYLVQTKDLGLCFGGQDTQAAPYVYVDADWAGDHGTRKSMSGCIVMMGGAAVTWYARQQEVVALSSTEAEYIAMCAGVKEIVWIRRLVQGLGVLEDSSSATPVLVDNQGAMDLVTKLSVNRRTKHIDVRYHYTRQAVTDGVVKLKYCPTEEMVADMMTKALGRIKMQKFVKGCGLVSCQSMSTQ